MNNIGGLQLIPESREKDSGISSLIRRFICHYFMMIITIIMKQWSMDLGIDELIPESLSRDSGISFTPTILFIDHCFMMTITIIMKQWPMNLGNNGIAWYLIKFNSFIEIKKNQFKSFSIRLN